MTSSSMVETCTTIDLKRSLSTFVVTYLNILHMIYTEFTCYDYSLNMMMILKPIIMSKKIKNETVVSKNTTNYVPRCFRGQPTPSTKNEYPEIIERPGHPIGRLLALQQVDGIDGSISNLCKGQFDEAYGDVDPASDIHTDPNMFRDDLMRAGYEKVMPNSKVN